MKTGFKINLESHNINHAISLSNIVPNFPEIGIKTRYIKKILKEMATIYARLINQYKFKYHILFSGSFYKFIEEDHRSDETVLFNNLNINQNLTENVLDKTDNKSQLQHQNQNQETNESGWIFDKIISMKKKFLKTGELNKSSYVKNPLRPKTSIDIKNTVK